MKYRSHEFPGRCKDFADRPRGREAVGKIGDGCVTEILHSPLVFLHICGAAALLGGWLANFKTPMVGLWQRLGAWLQLGTGVMLVGVAEMTAGDGGSGINHLKIGVKLVILLTIIVSAVLGRRATKRGKDAPVGLAHGVGGLTLVNIGVAVFW